MWPSALQPFCPRVIDTCCEDAPIWYTWSELVSFLSRFFFFLFLPSSSRVTLCCNKVPMWDTGFTFRGKIQTLQHERFCLFCAVFFGVFLNCVGLCVFPLQYSEKALYNQLCFYRFIFDWDHAVTKVLTTDERGKTIHTPAFLSHRAVRSCASGLTL